MAAHAARRVIELLEPVAAPEPMEIPEPEPEPEPTFESLLSKEFPPQMSPELARLLNYASSHLGYAAQADHWFNPPVSIEFTGDDVCVADVNERVAEIPFAFASTASLPAGGRVLDVGAGESTVSLSLATLGYRVVALDPRGSPFEHPYLEVVAKRIEDYNPDERFDAILCISTIEHIGLPAYSLTPSPADADRRALEALGAMLSPSGILVLTVPYAETARVDDEERKYDENALATLLEGWDITERRTLAATSRTVWEPAVEASFSERMVALITARRPS
jgi:SAM-dependent methyltransferase